MSDGHVEMHTVKEFISMCAHGKGALKPKSALHTCSCSVEKLQQNVVRPEERDAGRWTTVREGGYLRNGGGLFDKWLHEWAFHFKT